MNRIRDIYRDQGRLTGHHDRIEDLALFSGLGITKLRYPILWERVAPDAPGVYDWGWSDARVAEIRRLGMQPILGLLHHGSGPHYTNLLDPDFATLFADYAAAVAERYPDVADWTPINEPLTTARFSALYGHWYPHARDEWCFWTALLNQIDGIRLAMRAIRRVNPDARLIQTEDLGQTYATEPLAGVADHLNARRWLTWDLLAGRVDRNHPLWGHIEWLGLGERVRAIGDDPCPPDVIGVNHYLTSERFLDHRAEDETLPLPPVGYHDVGAVRALDPPPVGLEGMLRQTWGRYGIPLAITESHLGCTRDEQMRWIWQSWQTCLRLRDDGVDVRALTAWALLGSVDWNSLITVEAGHYEPGPFDMRSGRPRRTAVAALLESLGRGAGPPPRVRHVLEGAGWWQRELRLERAPYAWCKRVAERTDEKGGPPILITGGAGPLGRAIAGACHVRGLAHVLLDRDALDISDAEQVGRAIDHHRPWAVINADGWDHVDAAEDHVEECRRVNVDGAATLAAACAERGIHCTIFSSDLVFDGRSNAYIEADLACPLSAYGHSKAEGERRCLAVHGGTLVVRTAAFFSPYDADNFAWQVERLLLDGRLVQASEAHVVTPTFVPDLVNACLDLIIDDETGIWHLTNQEPVSWVQFGRRLADSLGLDAGLVVPADVRALGWRAPRPLDSSLGSAKGRMLPGLDDALARHAETRRRQRRAA